MFHQVFVALISARPRFNAIKRERNFAILKSVISTPFFRSSRSLSIQVSFRGVIVSRELRQSETPTQQLPGGFVEVPKFGPVKLAAVKNLQLGFTLLRNTIIQLRVKDLQSPNTMSVYLDLRRSNYVCGILPGKC